MKFLFYSSINFFKNSRISKISSIHSYRETRIDKKFYENWQSFFSIPRLIFSIRNMEKSC